MNPTEFNDILVKVNELLGTSDRIDLQISDPRVVNLVGDLHKAKVRVYLGTEAGIVVTFKDNNNVLSLLRSGKPTSAQPQATVSVTATAVPSAPAPASVPAPAPTPASTTAPIPTSSLLTTPDFIRKAKPAPKRSQHTYRPPKMLDDVIDVLADDASHVIWFKGPTGSGKTVAAHYICEKLGRQLFQMNCHLGMGPESLVGERTIAIDTASGQNFIKYMNGIAVNAMQCGLDADGNEIGRPGVLFIDEASAMPTTTAIMLNRLLESDDPRRTITLERDGGRIVRSHSGLRIILAANTCGRGANTMSESLYTAQTDALDISLLNRVAAVFRFGYDRAIEKAILMEKTGDDKAVASIIEFRDKIRDYIRAGQLTTPFSTRHIVKIGDMYRIFRDIPKAIYLSVMEQLLPTEMALYNETLVGQFGPKADVVKNYTQEGVDYM